MIIIKAIARPSIVSFIRKENSIATNKRITIGSISPLKNSQVINKIGSELENIYHINYLYSDFKKKEGYKRSIVLSHEYNLYRQDYCGCEFSKRD